MSNLVGGKTLHEINKMPRSEMLEHMRKYHHRDWGKEIKDWPDKEKKYKVCVELESEPEIETFYVEAHCERDAKTKAREYIERSFVYYDYNIENLKEVEW